MIRVRLYNWYLPQTIIAKYNLFGILTLNMIDENALLLTELFCANIQRICPRIWGEKLTFFVHLDISITLGLRILLATTAALCCTYTDKLQPLDYHFSSNILYNSNYFCFIKSLAAKGLNFNLSYLIVSQIVFSFNNFFKNRWLLCKVLYV